MQVIGSVFEAALDGTATSLELGDGRELPLAPHRWHRPADADDHWMLDRCTGDTIDLGCGPGRLVQALVIRGTRALGVDTSPCAIRNCADRGAPAVLRDVFGPLPDEGDWQQVILADGNIGIGGDPGALLRRAAGLLTVGGSVLVELAPLGSGEWAGPARLAGGPWFPWAIVGAEQVERLAKVCGLHVVDTEQCAGRWFAELGRDGHP